ncbi:MAG: DUF6089 family protein [Chitinophagaceae bacterium]
MKRRLHSFIGRYCLLFSLAILFSTNSFSQSVFIGTGKIRWEIGLNIGPSVFLGDLGGNAGKGKRFLKDMNNEFTKVIKGVFVTAYPNDWLGFRVAAQVGQLEGKDEIINTKGEDELYRRQRNLDFRSKLSEVYVAAEFFPTIAFNPYAEYVPALQPYVVAGIGMFKFNPQGSLTDGNGNVVWHDLKPLRTEGQGMKEYPERKDYNLTQINIPLGAGVKYLVSERLNLSFEVLYRKTFTDYIDDVSTEYIDPKFFDVYLSPDQAVIASQIHDKLYTIATPGLLRTMPGVQRGNPKQADAYFSIFLKLGFRIGSAVDNDVNKNAARKVRCAFF